MASSVRKGGEMKGRPASRSVPPLAKDFLLDPDTVYLNHAAYGATPRPVFESYQRWQRVLERDPVDFLSNKAEARLQDARRRLAAFVGSGRDDLVYITNATVGLNTVARSLRLGPGDIVLATAHEHGGIERMWRHWAARQGFEYHVQETRMPLTTHDDFVEQFWSAVSERTRVLFVSHISSPTGVILPVEDLCWRARARGITTVIDGAHAPGQLPLDLATLGADFYVGLAHKWLNAPKGSGFLYARPDVQSSLEPLAASWGVNPMNPNPSQFIDYHEWQGSRDISGFLAVPDAIAYWESERWQRELRRCRRLVRDAHGAVTELTGLPPFNPPTDEWNGQFFAVPLPGHIDPLPTARALYERDRIRVSVFSWQGKPKVRVSIQAYNDWSDVEALLVALSRVLA